MYLNALPSSTAGKGLGALRLVAPRVVLVKRGGRGMAGIVMHNFYGTMIPYNTVDVEMQAVADRWKQARGNGTGYADRSVQRDPANCADLVNVANDHCGLAPEACQGFNIQQIAASLCADYGAWFNQTFPKGWGDAYNYDDATYLAKFGAAALAERRAGSVGVVNPGQTGNSYPGGDPFFDQRGGVVAPTVKAPVVALPPVVVPQVYTAPPPPAAPPPPVPASTFPTLLTPSPSGSAPPPAAPGAGTPAAVSSFLGSSFDVFGYQVPAVGALAAAGVALWYMGSRK